MAACHELNIKKENSEIKFKINNNNMESKKNSPLNFTFSSDINVQKSLLSLELIDCSCSEIYKLNNFTDEVTQLEEYTDILHFEDWPNPFSDLNALRMNESLSPLIFRTLEMKFEWKLGFQIINFYKVRQL